MVTEIKFDDSDHLDFSNEMESLVREDLAAKRSRIAGGDTKVDVGDEAASRAEQGQGAALTHERGIESGDSIDLRDIITRQTNMEYVDLQDYPNVDFKVLRMLSADHAQQYKVFPIAFDTKENLMTLAISDPSDPTVVDDLSLAMGCQIYPVLADPGEIQARINQHYGIGEETIETLLDEFSEDVQTDVIEGKSGNVVDLSDMDAVVTAPPVVKLTNLILMRAIQDHASDIHIEPFEKLVRIRYRVDGVLREIESPPKDMQLGVISRLKVLANLDIAETRRPQDGRINLNLPGEREVELRVTSVPTVHGESIVMRVLDRSVMQMGIRQIGMSQDILNNFLKDLRKPNGIMLVTGPTGCGKTTTLYAAINEIRSIEDKLITTEDPVEYQVDGLIQVNINENVGLTYSRCLRSILRQDPDKILVGEIRDVDTARISVQAALTGHLVFSTLHTNSAAGTITRLIDMGLEPFLVVGTLQSVMGQRLVRTICPTCREDYTPTDEDLLEFGVLREDIADITFSKGAGCEECNYTGYRGRMGIFEYLPMTEEIAELVLEQATTDEINAMALKQGMTSLREDGWIKICMGLTTFAEVAAQTPTETAISVMQAEETAEENTKAEIEHPVAELPPGTTQSVSNSGIVPDSESAARHNG